MHVYYSVEYTHEHIYSKRVVTYNSLAYLKYISDTFSKETTAQSLFHAVVEINGFLQRVSLQDVNDRSEGLLLHHFGVGW